MEIILSIGLALCLALLILSAVKRLKDFILKQKPTNVDAEIAAYKKHAKVEVSEWVKREKERLQRQIEVEIAEKRSAAVAGIEAWASDEKKSLSTRFAKDYESEVAKLRQEMYAKMDSEFDNIKKLFSEFSAEEKKLAEEDIRRFIMKKLSQVT